MSMSNLTSALAKIHRTLILAYTAPVRIYRKYLSPLKGRSTCRFNPTCSQYAVEAVQEWGIVAGTALALWRIIRCNPFSTKIDDPVPKNPLRRKRD